MSRTFIIIILASFIIVGAGFFFVLKWGSQLPPAPQPSPVSPVAFAPAPPPPPSVSVGIEKSKNGNTIFIKWANLPDGTTELQIFRSPKGKNQWTLWKTIPVDGASLSTGSASFNVGKADYSKYDFYTEALGTGGNGGTVMTTSTLWTSDPTPPVTITPPPPPPPSPTPSGTDTQTPTSTPPPVPAPAPTPSPTPAPSSTPPPTPTGTPYYNPQVQISSYGGTPDANFWVQHVDQTIQMGWQNLPSITTNIQVVRSATSTGPWSPLLTQQAPSSTGSYTLQVVDSTVNEPYYYLMYANAGTTTVATYGPVYLPPVGQ